MTTLDKFARDPLTAALAYRELGISTFPIKLDGSKEPVYSGWRQFSERFPTHDEIQRWHSGRYPYGIGVTGGKASGNLAVLDFETWLAFQKWGVALTAEDRGHLERFPSLERQKVARTSTADWSNRSMG